MPQNSAYIDAIRKHSIRLFKHLARATAAGGGVLNCTFYSISQPASDRQNIYHDIVDKSNDPETGINTFCFIELNAPLKTVKGLGWWREEDSLPILMYMPYESTYTPEKGCRVILDSVEGYMSDTWEIQAVKTFGQDNPIAWVCNVVSKRTAN